MKHGSFFLGFPHHSFQFQILTIVTNYFPPRSIILPAQNNMSVHRWTDSYECHSRRWLGRKVTGRLEEQMEAGWFDLCGFDEWTVLDIVVPAANAGFSIDKSKKKKVPNVSFCCFLISFGWLPTCLSRIHSRSSEFGFGCSSYCRHRHSTVSSEIGLQDLLVIPSMW